MFESRGQVSQDFDAVIVGPVGNDPPVKAYVCSLAGLLVKKLCAMNLSSLTKATGSLEMPSATRS